MQKIHQTNLADLAAITNSNMADRWRDCQLFALLWEWNIDNPIMQTSRVCVCVCFFFKLWLLGNSLFSANPIFQGQPSWTYWDNLRSTGPGILRRQFDFEKPFRMPMVEQISQICENKQMVKVIVQISQFGKFQKLHYIVSAFMKWRCRKPLQMWIILQCFLWISVEEMLNSLESAPGLARASVNPSTSFLFPHRCGGYGGRVSKWRMSANHRRTWRAHKFLRHFI